MKQVLLMIAAVVMVGCGEDKSTVDVNLRTPGEPDDCEHAWSKWSSFSQNPEWKGQAGGTPPSEVTSYRNRYPDRFKGKSDAEVVAAMLQENPGYAAIYPFVARFAERNPIKRVAQYIPTTGGRPVAYQERTCSTCGKLDRN